MTEGFLIFRAHAMASHSNTMLCCLSSRPTQQSQSFFGRWRTSRYLETKRLTGAWRLSNTQCSYVTGFLYFTRLERAPILERVRAMSPPYAFSCFEYRVQISLTTLFPFDAIARGVRSSCLEQLAIFVPRHGNVRFEIWAFLWGVPLNHLRSCSAIDVHTAF